jgi:hypothetical protein
MAVDIVSAWEEEIALRELIRLEDETPDLDDGERARRMRRLTSMQRAIIERELSGPDAAA